MKYTEEQKKRLKNKGMNGFTKYDIFIKEPNITTKDGFYVIDSKINYE